MRRGVRGMSAGFSPSGWLGLGDKKSRREEMQAAAAIQQSILPGPLPRAGGVLRVDLHAEMHPAREIGGDFYDYFLIDEDRLAVTGADVSRQGIPAALVQAGLPDLGAHPDRRLRAA